MDLIEAIRTRRSIRAYRPDPVPRETIEQLLAAATLAPSAMNLQPWAFGVVTDCAKIRDLSERAKALLLGQMTERPFLKRFEEYFRNPDYSIFYHAPALIVIYSRSVSAFAPIDCALAAENLMLAARGFGLGSCWIGFGHDLLELPETKRELGVPPECSVAAPIIVGRPAEEREAPERKATEILYWI